MAVTLLEGFESISGTGPWTATNTWSQDTAFFPGAVTVTRTSSHPTQGSFDWRIQGTASSFLGPTIVTGPLDLSAYTEMYLDIFVASVDAAGAIFFALSLDGEYGDSFAPQSPDGFTGSMTLGGDITIQSGLSSIYIIIGSSALTGSVDFYIDNLRADDGAGGGTIVPQIMNSYRRLRA